MPRLVVRVNGRTRFSANCDSINVDESGGELKLSADVVKKSQGVVRPPVTPNRPDPTVVPERPEPTAVVDPEPTPDPDPTPEVVEPEVVDPEVTGEPDTGAEAIDGGTVDPGSGEITDPETNEVVGLVDNATLEVTDQSGEVVGTLDEETGEITDESGEVVATVEIGDEGGAESS
jgi:hypothetical protein